MEQSRGNGDRQEVHVQRISESGIANIQLGTLNTIVAGRDVIIQATITPNTSKKKTIKKNVHPVIKWLSELCPMNFHSIHKEIYAKVTPGSGNWIFELAKYKNWESGQSKTLWGRGEGGVGKTCLTSIVIDHLMEISTPATIIYIYCQFKCQLTTVQILASLLKQLVEKSDLAAQYVARSLYDPCTETQTRPIRSELVSTLQAVVKLFSRIFIAVDALDELDREVSWEVVNDVILLDQSLFVTSRSLSLPQLSGPDFEIRAQRQDIPTFAHSQHHNSSGSEGFSDLEESAGIKIASDAKTDRMLPLAEKQNSTTPTQRGDSSVASFSFDNLPGRTREAKYFKAIGYITNKSTKAVSRVYDALLCVLYATRILRIDELLDALTVFPKDVTFYKGSMDKQALIKRCYGLLTIHEESQTVHPIHHTLGEWCRTQSRGFNFKQPHKEMANLCAAYLSLTISDFTPIKSSDDLKEVERKNPFFGYAIRNLRHHIGAYGHFPQNVDLFFKAHPAILLLPSLDGDEFIDHGGPLHLAAWCGSRNTVSLYLSRTPKKELKSLIKNSPTFYACLGGNLWIVQKFLELKDFNCGWMTNFGGSCLHAAAESGNIQILQLLLEVTTESALDGSGAKKSKTRSQNLNLPLDAKLVTRGQTALDLAHKHGHAKIVKQLLAFKPEASYKGWTPLHAAVEKGDLDLVQCLIASPGVDINARQEDNLTPLHLAAQKGHIAIAQLLVAAPGVDANAETSQEAFTPLHLAAQNGHLDIVQLLVVLAGVDADGQTQKAFTPLHLAAQNGHADVAKVLVTISGVDVNAQDLTKYTPLHLAAQHGHAHVVHLLIALSGINVNAKTQEALTPLHLAAKDGHVDVVKCLVAIPQVNVNAQNLKASTAIHLAVQNGHANVTKVLIAAPGMDVNARTGRDQTPLYIAAQKGHDSVVDVLLSCHEIDVQAKVQRVSGTWETALKAAKINKCSNVVAVFEKFGYY